MKLNFVTLQQQNGVVLVFYKTWGKYHSSLTNVYCKSFIKTLFLVTRNIQLVKCMLPGFCQYRSRRPAIYNSNVKHFFWMMAILLNSNPLIHFSLSYFNWRVTDGKLKLIYVLVNTCFSWSWQHSFSYFLL